MKFVAQLSLIWIGAGVLVAGWLSAAPQGVGQGSARQGLVEVDAGTRKKAQVLLGKVAERMRGVRFMRAGYTQERTSPILIDPLVSSGVLFQRTSPACLVFRVESPHLATIRVDQNSYQVYRPDEGTAERFLFEGSHAGRALLGAFRPEAEVLFKGFLLVGFEQKEKLATLTLRPRKAQDRKHVDNVILRIDSEECVPSGVSYVDREGYVVDIKLTDVALDPKLDDDSVNDVSALFSSELPEGVKLLVHRIEEHAEK